MNTAGWTANDGSYINEETGTGWFPGEKVRLFPNDRRLHFEYAIHERIEPSLIEAGIEIKPCDIPVHHYGNFAGREKSVSKSEQYYQLGKRKLADAGEQNFMTCLEIAILGAELGKYEEALEYLNKVVELKPDFSRAWQSMGNAYYNLGKYKEALSSYKKALELGPEPRDIRHGLLMAATCELLTGNAAAAIAVAEDLLKNDGSYPQAMLLLAEAYFCTGAGDKAIGFIRKIEEMHFDVGGALVKFARMLASAGSLQYAVSLLEGVAGNDIAADEAKALLEELREKGSGDNSP
jgi:tetratricopeptide (TPR) repeat protein